MTYRLRILARAQRDVSACYSYIAERSAQGAASWFNGFVKAQNRLTVDAEQRKLAWESEHVDYDIREVLFKTRKGKPYRILFTIRGDEVVVLRVRGPGQDYLGKIDLPFKPEPK